MKVTIGQTLGVLARGVEARQIYFDTLIYSPQAIEAIVAESPDAVVVQRTATHIEILAEGSIDAVDELLNQVVIATVQGR